jgi:GntR family transcriptional repressor for pyruvate dehydrogenase complex
MADSDKKNPEQLFRPIRLERVAQKVATQLKKVISDGVFKVGERLPSERELAETMGVSRPSIREAIQQLEIMGMVETVHGGGSIVRNITEQQILRPIEIFLEEDPRKVLELTEVRAFMEGWAAKQAAKNRTEVELKRMEKFLRLMELDFDSGRIHPEADFSFHAEIAAASHNTIFLHLMHSIMQLIGSSVRIYREQIFVTTEEQETILNHHRKIFAAIRNRDEVKAQEAMQEHLQFVVDEYKKRFLRE